MWSLILFTTKAQNSDWRPTEEQNRPHDAHAAKDEERPKERLLRESVGLCSESSKMCTLEERGRLVSAEA